MDSVPYAFCDATCSVLWNLNPSCCLSEEFGMWKQAASKHDQNRDRVHVSISFINDAWWYRIEAKGQRMTFAELKNLNRKHLCVTSVELADRAVRGDESSLEEIKELATFTAPFLNLASFSFWRVVGSGDCQEFAKIIPFFMNVSIRDFSLGKNPRWTNAFVNHHLESGMVKGLSTYCFGYECDHRSILETFLNSTTSELLTQSNKSNIVRMRKSRGDERMKL